MILSPLMAVMKQATMLKRLTCHGTGGLLPTNKKLRAASGQQQKTEVLSLTAHEESTSENNHMNLEKILSQLRWDPAVTLIVAFR